MSTLDDNLLDTLTDEERAAQPAQLADIERRLSGNCQ